MLGLMVAGLTAVVISIHREIRALQRRVRALGVVESVIREADQVRPVGRYLRRVKAIVSSEDLTADEIEQVITRR